MPKEGSRKEVKSKKMRLGSKEWVLQNPSRAGERRRPQGQSRGTRRADMSTGLLPPSMRVVLGLELRKNRENR